MPSTASEPDRVASKGSKGPQRVATYRFAFSWEGPYGHAVKLVERYAQRGLVLDLGCGYAAVGEVLRDAGWEYVGGDRDTDAVADVVARGLEGHVIDLAMSDGLAVKLADIIEWRAVGAVLLLDIIEHLPDPFAVLRELARLSASLAADGREAPVLVTSIPNVAHFDLAAKLVGGRWDVTPSGLLDRTHLVLFTETRVDAELGRMGWQECGRDDVILEHSDQWFPIDHPFLVEGGPVHDHLRALRASADPNMKVNQFVRAYRRLQRSVPDDRISRLARHEDAVGIAPGLGVPFLSVLTRTEGTRPGRLAETLTCLASQRMEDLEVVVLVHGQAPGSVHTCEEVVDSFEESFASRVCVEQVRGDRRSAHLNAGLTLARGRYVAFLDEDELVTADWAQRFAEGAAVAPGKLIRSLSGVRRVREPAPDEGAMGASPVTLSKPVTQSGDRFTLLAHLAGSPTPLSSLALPRSLVSELHFCFDERLAAADDWDLVLRAALLVGVEETGEVTSIEQRPDDTAALTADLPEALEGARASVLAELDKSPLLLPLGSATALFRLSGGQSASTAHDSQLATLERELEKTKSALTRAKARPKKGQLVDESARVEGLLDRIDELEGRAKQAEKARDELLASEFWRATAPLRSMVSLFRGNPRATEGR
jgi:SAM-dependent methyltransferase